MKLGKENALRRPPPLRTVRASFPAYGSSNPSASLFEHGDAGRTVFLVGVMLPVTVRMQQYQVGQLIRSAFRALDDMVQMPPCLACNLLIA